MPQIPEPVWRKASFSNGTGGNNCVEVAHLEVGVAVRNSKNRAGAQLMFTVGEWTAFLSGAKAGEFDRP
jgi:hypothetical protein